MNTWSRGMALIRDSPTFGRDRANLWSGFTIGTTALLLNAAVMLMVFLFLNFPDEREFRSITEKLGFGQVLALILLGGATMLATLLVPLRLMTVFWGPRVGAYFDQIVLSGITPFRFVIGKATSQNLFLALALFLLLPYMVLSLMFGGVNFSFFIACILLVWIYCMALALVTLWLSLYFNELIAAILTVVGAAWLVGLGCVPNVAPYVPVTPTPFLLHPVHEVLPQWTTLPNLWQTFATCLLGTGALATCALGALYLGPLYGVIRENSTFGEVVRRGDSRRKRWFRLRYHIQRPSEIAFFYENRPDTFHRGEAWIRWGFGLLVLTAATVTAHVVFLQLVAGWGAFRPGRGGIAAFHSIMLMIFAFSLLFAGYLFSHNKNTALLRLPWVGQNTISASRLDTFFYASFVLVSSLVGYGLTLWFERYTVAPAGTTLFPPFRDGSNGPPVDYHRMLVEGRIVLALSALVVYATHRTACLFTWLKSPVFLGALASYMFLICLPPFFLGVSISEIRELREMPLIAQWGPTIALLSPLTVLGVLIGEMGRHFPSQPTFASFYIAHAALLVGLVWIFVRRQRKLQPEYLWTSRGENQR